MPVQTTIITGAFLMKFCGVMGMVLFDEIGSCMPVVVSHIFWMFSGFLTIMNLQGWLLPAEGAHLAAVSM